MLGDGSGRKHRVCNEPIFGHAGPRSHIDHLTVNNYVCHHILLLLRHSHTVDLVLNDVRAVSHCVIHPSGSELIGSCLHGVGVHVQARLRTILLVTWKNGGWDRYRCLIVGEFLE